MLKKLVLAAFMTFAVAGIAGAQTQLQSDLADIHARYATLHKHEFFTTTYPTFEENQEIIAAFEKAKNDQFNVQYYGLNK